jgi:hypothetical protein
MQVLERYPGRYDIVDCYCQLIAIVKSQREASAFVSAWRPAKPNSFKNEVHSKHDAYRPIWRRS